MSAETRPDQFEAICSDVIHLARFGAEGRSRDVQALARRMSQKYRKNLPEFSHSLAAVATGDGSLRAAKRPMPVDADSRMALARVVDSALAARPVLPKPLEDQVNQLLQEHRQAAELRQAGLAPSKTALLVGPPGVGKTMTAQWIAKELDRPLVVLDLASSMSSFLGKTGQNVRQLFDFAKEFDCVLLLDEVDAIAKKRADDTDLGELKRLVNVLLQELDGWPEGSLLLAATNHPGILDPAIWRRFELVFDFPMPSAEQRLEVVRNLIADQDAPFLAMLADVSEGLSSADIAAKVNAGRRTAVLSRIDERDGVLGAFAEHIRRLPKTLRHGISEKLVGAGASQRMASELTGTSRNTLRKNVRKEKAA